MNKKIYFTEKEIQKAINFADSIKWKHTCTLDAEKDIKRDEKDVYISVLRGKFAEIALKSYLKTKHNGSSHKITGLDFNIYRKGITDDFDLKFDKYKISIKSSKPFASCLLVESDKYKVDYYGNPISIEGHEDGIPDFYAFVKVNIDYNKISDSYAVICGAISHKEFWRKKKEIPKGVYINKENMDDLFINNKQLNELKSKKGAPLVSSNYALHLDLLKPI